MTWEAQKDYHTGYTRDDWKQPPLYATVLQAGIRVFSWHVSRNLENPNIRGENWMTVAHGNSEDRATAKREAKAALMTAITSADKTFALRWFGK